MKPSWYVIIAGCGRLGANVAGMLSNMGHSVVVIDRKESAFEALPIEFTGFTIHGDVAAIEFLREAKIHQANMVLAFTNDDNTNFMVAQIAQRVYHIPRVISRVYDAGNLALFHEFKIKTLTPVLLATGALNKVIHRYMEESG
jgi:trk system potassium uptake protein TrkA